MSDLEQTASALARGLKCLLQVIESIADVIAAADGFLDCSSKETWKTYFAAVCKLSTSVLVK
jgi:hypothetical protein